MLKTFNDAVLLMRILTVHMHTLNTSYRRFIEDIKKRKAVLKNIKSQIIISSEKKIILSLGQI